MRMYHLAYLLFLSLYLSFAVVSGDRYHPHHKPSKEFSTKAVDSDKTYWNAQAQIELTTALNLVPNTNVAKNVILFLGDGMGVATVTAARIYEGQQRGNRGEEGLLSFESFPYLALSKTYNVDRQVPDSAGTGTAYLCGSKTNYGVVGLDGRVERGVCEGVIADTIVHSIAKQSQEKGKRTGVVTSARITHATPAALYAHVPERDWECNTEIPATSLQNCPYLKDIARQLVEDLPGKDFNIIMGGGYQELDGTATDLPGDPVEPFDCVRSDNMTLWQDWLDAKQAEGKSAAFVRNKSQLSTVDLTTTEHLMGIFANSHIPYEHEKIDLGLDLPTLTEMTEAAITLLSQEPNGFFLLVEGGRIDLAHHDSHARTALDEAVAMHEAVAKAVELTNEQDTLIIVTADHSHTMTINGYPDRGNIITGTAGTGNDLLPYTTLSYANGPGYNFTVQGGEAVRGDLRDVDTSAWDFAQQSTVPETYESHGGEDVAIYARGPMAHLFHSVHEENYIAHVMAYASCVDALQQHCTVTKRSNVKI